MQCLRRARALCAAAGRRVSARLCAAIKSLRGAALGRRFLYGRVVMAGRYFECKTIRAIRLCPVHKVKILCVLFCVRKKICADMEAGRRERGRVYKFCSPRVRASCKQSKARGAAQKREQDAMSCSVQLKRIYFAMATCITRANTYHRCNLSNFIKCALLGVLSGSAAAALYGSGFRLLYGIL